MMTERQIETAVDEVAEMIRDHNAYNPTNATKQNSLDFLMGIRDEATILIDAIHTDMANAQDAEGGL